VERSISEVHAARCDNDITPASDDEEEEELMMMLLVLHSTCNSHSLRHTDHSSINTSMQ
jgi:hypothetical protein